MSESDPESPTVTIDRGLFNDLRGLFRAARGIRNTMHKLTTEGLSSKADWEFAKQARYIFSTLSTLGSIVTLIETKHFAPEDKCPACGHELS